MKMHSVPALVFLLSCLVCLAVSETQVQQCEGKKFDQTISISKCTKPPCKLKKKSTIVVETKFKPDHDIQKIRTNVFGEILGLPLPFVGVDGISACDKIFAADGTTKVPCPLKANTEYVYKNSFPILEIYPRLTLVVGWSLSDENNKDVLCFRVDARIV